MINTILFDLDGTLLPLDEDQFINIYFTKIGETFSKQGFDKKKFVEAVWIGTKAMVENDGVHSNEIVFWDTFQKLISCDLNALQQDFLEFYQTHFDEVRNSVNPSIFAKKCIDLLKKKGYRIGLATNPLFPQIATFKRIAWAGLKTSDFEIITTYENSNFAKPNLKYFETIFTKLNVTPSECLMVGNDASEDMIIESLGASTFLLTDCLNNHKGVDISLYEHGSFEELYVFLSNLPDLEAKK
ncbi:MAG: HAD family hydrolase [Firmicutes bacterium]|nr:HAD family hydrolase [Bacillota bacterium]